MVIQEDVIVNTDIRFTCDHVAPIPNDEAIPTINNITAFANASTYAFINQTKFNFSYGIYSEKSQGATHFSTFVPCQQRINFSIEPEIWMPFGYDQYLLPAYFMQVSIAGSKSKN